VPWWFWVLLWAVLAVGGLAAAAIAGYWLFRKGFAVVRDAGESLERLVPDTSRESAQADDDGAPAQEQNAPAAGSAVFAHPAAMAQSYAEGKALRREARRRRRIERRALRGQPQSLRDLGLD
jgi:hypothetical protein